MLRLFAPAGLSSSVRRPGTVLAGWGLGPFGFLLGWYGVSPYLTPMSPALMCLYHVDRHGIFCPGISFFMWQRVPATYADGMLTAQLDFLDKPSETGAVQVVTFGGSATRNVRYENH